MSGTAVERIVVQAAPQEKSVMLKAKKLGLCFPPLRRTHPIGYALTIGGAKRWQFTDEFKREAIRFASQPGGRAGPRLY